MFEKLLNINPNNLAIIFLYNRIRSKNYRGIHIVQQQRYSYSELLGLLLALYAVAGIEKIDLPKGDPDTEEDVKNYPLFKKAVQIYKAVFKKGTYMTVKKIDFLNLSRMGLINRYNSKGKLISPNSKTKDIKSISLSHTGLILLEDSDNSKNIFNNSLKNLLNDLILDIFKLLSMDNIYGKITFQEFMFFVSYLGQKTNFDDTSVKLEDVYKYILEYRKLTIQEQGQIINVIKEISNITEGLSKSKGKIDYTNWRNQSGSIFNLLSFVDNLRVVDNELIYELGDE